MAPMIQEPEIQFAQRLASNEKPIRTKAIKKLRKYLSIRSQRLDGGFSIEELLKIWKGLFYCLWMQDKPLLQDELSEQISRLIHCLQNVDVQFIFLESFMKTINREWNGIDRLRMDKFYRLVRFVFREAFEMLKKTHWDASLIQRFLEFLTNQVLSGSSNSPAGVQFHILDIYMEELAKVGARQLTAEQNLTFIDPFCKMAAKSKNKSLVHAICSSVFKEIVDKAPFAIEDLMREIQAGDFLASDAQENEDEEEEEEEEEEDVSDTEEHYSVPPEGESEVGPMLQFDYKAVADRLVQLASRNNTPIFNRKRLYREVKTFQDLSRGVFPQDEYPEDVSTDEDDDMFGSRQRLKRRRRNRPGEDEEDEDNGPKSKKRKGKKDAQDEIKLKKGSVEGKGLVNETVDPVVKNSKKRKTKRMKGKAQSPADTEQHEGSAREAPQDRLSCGAGRTTGGTAVATAQPVGPGHSSVPEQGETQRASNKTHNETAEPQAGEVRAETRPADSTPGHKKRIRRKRRSSSSTHEGERVKGSEPGTGPTSGGDSSPAALDTQNGEAKEAETEPGMVTRTPADQESSTTKMKKRKRKNDTRGANEGAEDMPSTDERPAAESPAPQLRKKMKKKKKGQPSAGDSQGTDGILIRTNGHVEGAATRKMTNKMDIVSSPISNKTPLKKMSLRPESDFVKFQSNTSPAPLFCRKSKGSPGTPAPTKQSRRTPKSESKKVTFGLKNNQTAEFRKMDRSLLLSPEGSSRVPFDPQQKPRFGVLKSPVGPQCSKKGEMSKKSEMSNRGRACAADFF